MVGLSALWAFALAGSARAALPANCSQSGNTVTCAYTGAGTYSFAVPAGVSSLDVTAVGAAGGGGNVGTPGQGASVEDTSVAVSATQALGVVVGGVGGDGSGTVGGAGGTPGGGGPAGDFPTGNSNATFDGGGGGGFSGLFDPSNTPLVIAGAGGGAGATSQGGAGDIGTGGGTGGAAGCTNGGTVPGGGTTTPPAGGTPGITGNQGAGNGTIGQSLAGGQGGASGAAPGFANSSGGGGGGGYFGGGGGYGAQPDCSSGGGGGSSFGITGLTNEFNTSAAASVTIKYTVPAANGLAATLVHDSTGKAPGTALVDKATAIQTAVNANPPQTATACADITNYLGLVNAQTGKKLTPGPNGTAALLTTDANNLAAALGC